MQTLFATQVASISELKKNPTKLINDSQGKPIAILNHNTVNDNKLIVTVIAVGKRNNNEVYDEAESRKE